jgi:hypothetical protein
MVALDRGRAAQNRKQTGTRKCQGDALEKEKEKKNKREGSGSSVLTKKTKSSPAIVAECGGGFHGVWDLPRWDFRAERMRRRGPLY